jgi:DNA modification methylase
MTLRDYVFYQEPGITLYCGDCRDVLPLLAADERLLVVITDPPYGIAWSRGVNHARASKAHEGIVGDEDTSARDGALSLLDGVPGIVSGSFYAPFPAATKQVLIWHKPPDAGLVGSVTGFRRDAEPIFLTGAWPQQLVQWSCVLRSDNGQSATTTETGHPHTKPLSLMTRLVALAPVGTVLDPFAGSGTTLVAAKELGRRAIGIEIEPKYCEIAVKRLRQEVLRFEARATA